MIQQKITFSDGGNSDKNTFIQEAISFFYILLIALSIRIFIFEPFYIPTGSMRTTILEGDYVFSTKYSYGYSRYSIPFSPGLFSGRVLSTQPQRGDIIIFRPPHEMNERYIKRLIGLPGDKIQLIKGVVYVNEKPIPREFVQNLTVDDFNFKQYREIVSEDKTYLVQQIDNSNVPPIKKAELAFANNIGPVIVPNDHFFFLGDNRDQSGDSRFALGVVPFENLIGKAQFILFSFKEPLWLNKGTIADQIKQIGLWASSVRFERMFKKL